MDSADAEKKTASVPVTELEAGSSERPHVRFYGLIALAFLAGVGEHFIQFGIRRVTGLSIPLIGAIVAGALMGLVLRFRAKGLKWPVLILMVLMARSATLYVDYAEYRDNRIARFERMKRVTDALAVQKLAQEGHEVERVAIDGMSAKELFENDLKQQGGRGGFIGYLGLLMNRGVRNRAGERVAGAWGVVVFLLAASAILGAACVLMCYDTSLTPGETGPKSLT